ncbi:MAG: phosphate ABC transporter permease PstA [Clostridiales bacterium]|nr:phosphate ABC transporter permease PstA [Clostridiales bacterium]
MTLYKKKKRPLDALMYGLIYFSGIFVAALLAGIIIYIVVNGVPSINRTFLSTIKSVATGTFGILGYMVNTLYIIIITLLIATPIGIGAAVYLTEYAKPGRLVSFIEFATETLSGIPSIIFGLFGMAFFGQSCHLGFSIICGSLTLTLMILPIVIRTTQEALKTVPESYRQGALGLGAKKWRIIRTIVLPSALPGIVTAIILAVGRIVGESAALLFTAGSSYLLPKALSGIFSHIMESGGTMTIGLYLEMAEGNTDHAFGIALILIVLVLGINFLTKFITSKITKG